MTHLRIQSFRKLVPLRIPVDDVKCIFKLVVSNTFLSFWHMFFEVSENTIKQHSILQSSISNFFLESAKSKKKREKERFLENTLVLHGEQMNK